MFTQRLTLLVSILACLFLPVAVRGQVNSASLSGLGTDQTNAALVRAQVTVSNSATEYSRQSETDASGYYSFQDLPIGEYKIVVSLQNFQSIETHVTLGTAERVRSDFVLKIGTAEANVEVTDVVNNLSPDDASIGTVIDNQTIQGTPLYLRNWDDLLRMVAGVQISRYTQQSGATSAGRVGDFNVHGVHSLQNNFLLDGIDNNTISENVQELSTEASHPSVDTIQEFNVVTNPYSAEYGRSPGAAVSISTKGGSNQFHGLAYEYLRNQFFDANDFISNSHNLTKPENNQNQFGGNFGGPILKNKVFGFFDYEGTRIKQGVSRVSTVPLPNERSGDFSPETATSLGLSPYPIIYDPTTGAPFADNKIPSGRIDTAVAGLMALFPVPNLDLKSEEPAHLAAIWQLLTEYRDWITTARRASEITDIAPLDAKPILVFTGESDAQKAVFYDRVPVGSSLLVFGATPTSTTDPSAPPSTIAANPADNYHRWWNNSWHVVEPAGQPNAGEWTSEKEARLNDLVRFAHQRGFWIRFYTLDGVSTADESCRGIFHGYNFGSQIAVQARWQAAARAGADYIATDQYEDLGRELRILH